VKTAQTIEAQATQKKTGDSTPQNKPKLARLDATRIAPWRWKKGFCPNPGGRPKKDRAQEIAKEIFEQNPEAVYKAMAKALLQGNAYAFGQLADRAYGKLIQKQELTGKDGGPVEYQDINESDINKRISDLLRDLGLTSAIDEAGRVASTHQGAGPTNGKAEASELLPR
jgi:hypothetical protein